MGIASISQPTGAMACALRWNCDPMSWFSICRCPAWTVYECATHCERRRTVRLSDGRRLIEGRRITGFTNAEELFLIEDAPQLFPYLLQEQVIAGGAQFVEGPMYLDNTIVDGRLITGQNPWSTWTVATAMITALGHEPVPRDPTAEEISVQILSMITAKAPQLPSDRESLRLSSIGAW